MGTRRAAAPAHDGSANARVSLTAGAVAEELGRHWIAGEAVEEYIRAGAFRFEKMVQNPTLF